MFIRVLIKEKIMAEKVRTQFEELAHPLVQFINDNYHPHTTIIITSTTAEVLEGVEATTITDYVKV